MRLRTFAKATAISALATAAVAVPAGANDVVFTEGSLSTPALPGVQDATLKLGPLGTKQISGVKDLKVTYAWRTRAAGATLASGSACTIDRGVFIDAGRNARISIDLSYVKDNPAPMNDERIHEHHDLVGLSQDAATWEFGVCYGGQ
jgi:hypothetical protein